MANTRTKMLIAVMIIALPMQQKAQANAAWPLLAAVGIAGVCSGIVMAGQSLYEWFNPTNATLLARAQADFAKRTAYEQSLQKVRAAYNISDQWLINNGWILHSVNEELLYSLASKLWQGWVFQQPYRATLQSYVSTLSKHVNALYKRIEQLDRASMLTEKEIHESALMRSLANDMSAWQKELNALSTYIEIYGDYFALAEQAWLLDYNYKKELDALSTYSYDHGRLMHELKYIARNKHVDDYYVAIAYVQQLDRDIDNLNYVVTHTTHSYPNQSSFALQVLGQLHTLRSSVNGWYESELLHRERKSLAQERAILYAHATQRSINNLSRQLTKNFVSVPSTTIVPVVVYTKVTQNVENHSASSTINLQQPDAVVGPSTTAPVSEAVAVLDQDDSYAYVVNNQFS